MKVLIFALATAAVVHAAPQAIPTNEDGTIDREQLLTQCGGKGWTGSTECKYGYQCVYYSESFSQCNPPPSTRTTIAPSPVPWAPLWGQCGGQGWTGPTVCAPGSSCVYLNNWHSQCLAPSTTTATTTTTTATSASSTVPVYGQCAGIGYTGPTECATGSYCAFYNIYESQCLPNGQSFTNTVAPPTTTTTTTKTTTVAPTQAPAKTWGQCHGVGWTGPTTCEAGAVCYIINQHYGLCYPESSVPAPTTCPTGQVYNSCGSACPRTCANRNDQIICTAQCVQGCFCASGTVLDSTGKCVAPSQCPVTTRTLTTTLTTTTKATTTTLAPSPVPTCSKGQVYNTCGSACPRTCANLNQQIGCAAVCVKGCFCPSGTVVDNSGKCVAPSQCPVTTVTTTTKATTTTLAPSPVPTCSKGQVYNTCGSACPRTCANLNQQIGCAAVCVKGCFCPSGTVVDNGGKCVKPEQCPRAPPKL